MVEELDLTSLECPEPFMKVVAKLMKMDSGELKIRYKDPKCREMILEAMKLMNCQVLEDKQANGIFSMHIKKEKSSMDKPNKKVELTGSC
ncbi:oxidoreductase [Sulfolobus sp. A20]|uniref:sulfurtransferase TusA family protein n=1 Tax=Saccharolobus sp. A20 TaxID=1891280 RepID=UPI00084610FD|nr:sulfurtransferase TusA family protein [Sulfolobus sp. A20]TRM75457.1 sulfurtransferase TusA family protein [Sulfolobus sp. E5]TRM77038.1 sulfurtransferase TusA family protein [Sulfolobus sp. A20-N-F8]TRM81018.1 sulfurtransferase TusA family protein [Sulfolobus sp. D5]TRM83752.1 sulfurtransferase TusA family protein [Sulfolobus sp. A20-N-F6]TRM84709.1 sulfurtransferase TusA family protein [Sulfolobus sp. E3]TRM88447.1 sulfurtransferase TusA family protein [Sulfolobus sp. C3]TRM98331.1 sulf